MKNFNFGVFLHEDENCFLARIDPEIANTKELLTSIGYLLWFPGYYGVNWNALSDCLRDFHWMKDKKVVMVHECIPKIDEDDFILYLEVLMESINDWGDDDEHELEVWFNAQDKNDIQSLLSESR